MELTREYLYQLYVQERLSLRKIAAKEGLYATKIRALLKKFEVPLRTKSEALSGSLNPMFGKTQSEEARKRISETLHKTNQDPEVKAKRSRASSGANNSMYGRTHTPEIREASRIRLKKTRKDPSFKIAHLNAMRRPEVRAAISEKAKQRVGDRNPFYGKVHSRETRQRISQANQGRLRGPNGPNWQGGKTALGLLIRNSERSVAWRKAVFERDHFTCQMCGQVGGSLHADHIRPFAVLLSEYNIKSLGDAYACAAMWDLSNGRTLCVPCHKKTPSFAGNFQKNYRKGVKRK